MPQKGDSQALSSSWHNETLAVFTKEVVTEMRGKYGLYSTLLFSVMSVTALGLASAREQPSPAVLAGLLWVALLFAAITGLSRTFLLEEEQGTGDLLRLWAKPSPVFWGKLCFNFLLLLVVEVVTVPMFALFADAFPSDTLLFCCALVAGSLGLASGISVCGALASRASGKGTLVGVISIPILLPIVALGIGALRIAFGDGGSFGWTGVAGLAGLAIAFMSVGPYLFAATWKQ
jgi:heme exporter protein B